MKKGFSRRFWALLLGSYLAVSWFLAWVIQPVWSFVIKRPEIESGEDGFVTQFAISPLMALMILFPLAWWLKRKSYDPGPILALAIGIAGLIAYGPSFLRDLSQDIHLIATGASDLGWSVAVGAIVVRWLFSGMLVALVSLPVWLLARSIAQRLP